MSLHKSKGLTSKVVIVAGCVDGLIPTLKEDLEGSEEVRHMSEQRRLFYVALTRCTDMLVLSLPAKIERATAHRMRLRLRPNVGTAKHGVPFASRFVNELGPAAPQPITGEVWAAKGYR
jgi:superfamily I DNA/RNA helicase